METRTQKAEDCWTIGYCGRQDGTPAVPRRPWRAFTLIELLIVVAIIAILAAIAVPNFLQAQVRSKVARVRTDMRSGATAIEAYRVDNQEPPVGIQFWVWIGGVTDRGIYTPLAWQPLTTPVAYITAMLRDPFAQDHFGEYRRRRWLHLETYEDAQLREAYLQGREAFELGFRWSIKSFGPARYPPVDGADALLPGRIDSIYDPTNGTRSPGIIIRTNKVDAPQGLVDD